MGANLNGRPNHVYTLKLYTTQSTINTARVIERRLQQLQEAGIQIRWIDNPSVFSPSVDGHKIVLGGAFVGECLQDYIEAAGRLGVVLTPDPLLSLKLD